MFPSKLEAEVTSKSKDPERDSHSDAGYLSHKDKTFDPDVHMAIPTEKGALCNLGITILASMTKMSKFLLRIFIIC